MKRSGKELERVWGGKVLEYEAKDILNRGRAEGRDEGRREGRAEGEITGMKKAKMQLAVKLLQAGNSVAYVARPDGTAGRNGAKVVAGSRA